MRRNWAFSPAIRRKLILYTDFSGKDLLVSHSTNRKCTWTKYLKKKLLTSLIVSILLRILQILLDNPIDLRLDIILKWDMADFPTANFAFICSNIPVVWISLTNSEFAFGMDGVHIFKLDSLSVGLSPWRCLSFDSH